MQKLSKLNIFASCCSKLPNDDEEFSEIEPPVVSELRPRCMTSIYFNSKDPSLYQHSKDFLSSNQSLSASYKFN